MATERITMPRNVRADESVLHPATPTTTSLRVTVPAYIVAKMDLKKGDRFRWHIEDNGIRIQVFHEIDKENIEKVES